MRRLMMVGFVGILVVSGCASTKPAATRATPEVARPAVAAAPDAARAAAVATAPDSVPPSSPPAPTSPPGQSESSSVASNRSVAPIQAADAVSAVPPPSSAAPGSIPTTAKSSTGIRPAKQASAAAALGAAKGPATTSRPPTPGKSPTPPLSASSAPPVSSASTPAPQPTLNLADLKQRLRETSAIGVFTKLSLKNQVDDLLKSFRDLYRDPNKRPSAELRQRYDLLLLKVLSLLQDSDPPLATAIASSREAIWSILADPDKFAKI